MYNLMCIYGCHACAAVSAPDGLRRQRLLRSISHMCHRIAAVGRPVTGAAPAVLTSLALVLRGGGGNFAKFADMHNEKLATVSCQQCGYTELYKGETSMLGNIPDFLVGG